MADGDFVWGHPRAQTDLPPAETMGWLERTLEASVVSTVPLDGGISSAVYRVDLDGGAHRTVVMRRMTLAEWLEREPETPRREATMLGQLATLDLGVRTPELIAADTEAAETDVPTIVMTHVPGRPDVDPENPVRWAEQLAASLARMHQASEPPVLFDYARWDDPNRPPPPWIRNTAAWAEATRRIRGPLPPHPTQFIHRDYHPCNVHWRGGEIVGVVDWLGAARGPVAVDLTHCRWNLAVLCDASIADHLLEHYRVLTGYSEDVSAYDLATVLSAPPGSFPTFAWNALGRTDLTPAVVADRVEEWLTRLLGP